MSADDCPLQERLVSSANMEALVVCRQFGRSLTYKLNSKGPRFGDTTMNFKCIRHGIVYFANLFSRM